MTEALAVTFFDDFAAKSLQRRSMSLEQLAAMIQSTTFTLTGSDRLPGLRSHALERRAAVMRSVPTNPAQVPPCGGSHLGRSTGCKAHGRAASDALLAWKPQHGGSFATIELAIGLRLNYCPIFDGPKGPCITLPARPVLHRDGQRKININGKVLTPQWRDRALADEFSQIVIALVRQAHPSKLDED